MTIFGDNILQKQVKNAVFEGGVKKRKKRLEMCVKLM